jgi:hypothetical protein
MKLPGFKHFLQPTTCDELVQAAQVGPIVVINCQEDHCNALLVMPGCGYVTHIALPDFTGAKAQCTQSEMEKSVRSRKSSERRVRRRPVQEEDMELENVLADLWYNVVKPVLDFMGYTVCLKLWHKYYNVNYALAE